MSTLVPKEIIANVLMAAQVAAQQTMKRAGDSDELPIFYEGYVAALSVIATALNVPVNLAPPVGLASRAWSDAWIPSPALTVGEDVLTQNECDET